MTLSTKNRGFYGFYICSQWAFIHALLSRVPFALAGLSCMYLWPICYCRENCAHCISLRNDSTHLCRLFGSPAYCSYCEQPIAACDMVMRAKENVYHLECFACFKCQHRSDNYACTRSPHATINGAKSWLILTFHNRSLLGNRCF